MNLFNKNLEYLVIQGFLRKLQVQVSQPSSSHMNSYS